MNKRDLIISIRAARADHIRWKAYISIALRGIVTTNSEEMLPIVHTECGFGKWYYGVGSSLSSLENYQSLEDPHEMLHEMYIQIYTLQKAKLRGGFFTSKRRLLRRRKAEIVSLVANLNDYSKIITTTLRQLENDVLNMSNADIENLINLNDEANLSNDFDYFIKKVD